MKTIIIFTFLLFSYCYSTDVLVELFQDNEITLQKSFIDEYTKIVSRIYNVKSSLSGEVLVDELLKDDNVKSVNSEEDVSSGEELVSEEIFTGDIESGNFVIKPVANWHMDRVNQRKLPLDFSIDNNPNAQRGENTNMIIVDLGFINHQQYDISGNRNVVFKRCDYISCNTEKIPETTEIYPHGICTATSASGVDLGISYKSNLILFETGSGPINSLTYWSTGLRDAIRYAKESKLPSIINMSFGCKYPGTSGCVSFLNVMNSVIEDTLLENDTSKEEVQHILFVRSAMNNNIDTCIVANNLTAPFNDYFLHVGATEIDDDKSSFSNWGNCVDIYGPGSSITCGSESGFYNYKRWSGTSFSAPQVSGALSALWSRYPNKSGKEIKEMLLDISTKDVINNNCEECHIGSNKLLYYKPETLCQDQGITRTDDVLNICGNRSDKYTCSFDTLTGYTKSCNEVCADKGLVCKAAWNNVKVDFCNPSGREGDYGEFEEDKWSLGCDFNLYNTTICDCEKEGTIIDTPKEKLEEYFSDSWTGTCNNPDRKNKKCCDDQCGICADSGCGSKYNLKDGSQLFAHERCCGTGIESLDRVCGPNVGPPCIISEKSSYTPEDLEYYFSDNWTGTCQNMDTKSKKCCDNACGICTDTGCGSKNNLNDGSEVFAHQRCCGTGIQSLNRICGPTVGPPCLIPQTSRKMLYV